APEDKFAGLAPSTLLARAIPELDLEDAQEPSAETLVDRARDAEQAGLSIPGVTNSEGGGASFSRSAVALATSSGFYGRYAGTSHGIGVAVLAGGGTPTERGPEQGPPPPRARGGGGWGEKPPRGTATITGPPPATPATCVRRKRSAAGPARKR